MATKRYGDEVIGIKVSHALTIGGIIIAAVSAYWSFDARQTIIEQQVKNIGSLVEHSIRLEEQIKSLDRRILRFEQKVGLADGG